MKMSKVQKGVLSGVGFLTTDTAATPYASYLSTMPELTNTGTISATPAPSTASSIDNITQSIADLANTILGIKAAMTPAPKPVVSTVTPSKSGTIAGISMPILLIGGLLAWKVLARK